MTLNYLPVHFYCQFVQSVHQDNNLLFVLRSVLGANLRMMCCITHQSKCFDCIFRQSCVYATFFETIIDKDNSILPGRNTASHPFAFTQNASDLDNVGFLTRFDFTFMLLGSSVKFLPYIYTCFLRAGKSGLFHSRTQYCIEDVIVGGQSILQSDNKIDSEVRPLVFDDNDVYDNAKSVSVRLISPLRFRVGGNYVESFTAVDFFRCLYRRYRTLMSLYGTGSKKMLKLNIKNISITKSNLFWHNYSHYSARRKQKMNLCGLLGTFTVAGDLTSPLLSLLAFNKLFNAGKGTNFGLGQFDYTINK